MTLLLENLSGLVGAIPEAGFAGFLLQGLYPGLFTRNVKDASRVFLTSPSGYPVGSSLLPT